MILEGNTDVIAAIKEKKRLMDAEQPHDHIRPLFIQGGGLMRGVYGAGAVVALEELGYTKCFDTLVGASSGAPTIAHFAAGSAKQGAQVLIEECTSRKFINFWRLWNQVDTTYFMHVMRQDPEKKVIASKVFENPATVAFGLARYEDAAPVVLSPETEDGLFMMMHASVNIQNVSNQEIFIDGVRYTDGGFAQPHVYNEIISTFNATHVLLITNNDQNNTKVPVWERFLNRTLFRLRSNAAITRAMNARQTSRDLALEKIRSSQTPVAIVWGNGSVRGVERRPEKIAAALEASRVWWRQLFA